MIFSHLVTHCSDGPETMHDLCRMSRTANHAVQTLTSSDLQTMSEQYGTIDC